MFAQSLQICKEFSEVPSVPGFVPPQHGDRRESNVRALMGFSTDMPPWDPFAVPWSHKCFFVHCRLHTVMCFLQCSDPSLSRRALSRLRMHFPRKLCQAPWPTHVVCRWFMDDVSEKADYVASTALVDLADHESFFWTQSVSGLELLVVSVCAGVGGGVLGFCLAMRPCLRVGAVLMQT